MRYGVLQTDRWVEKQHVEVGAPPRNLQNKRMGKESCQLKTLTALFIGIF